MALPVGSVPAGLGYVVVNDPASGRQVLVPESLVPNRLRDRQAVTRARAATPIANAVARVAGPPVPRGAFGIPNLDALVRSVMPISGVMPPTPALTRLRSQLPAVPQGVGTAPRDPELEKLQRYLREHGGMGNPDLLKAGYDVESLRELVNSGSSPVGYVARNALGELVDMAMGVPSALQLAGEGVAYLPLAGVDAVAPRGSLADRIARNARQQIEEHYKAAGTAIKDDYAYRWGPFFEGDFGTGFRRVAEKPVSFAGDLALGFGAVGRAPSAAAKVAARVAPKNSRIAERARDFTSIQAKGERDVVTGKKRTKHGARYREDKVYVGRTHDGDGTLVETNKIRVPQRPYSSNVITRGVQKGVGKVNRKVIRPRVERAAAAASRAEGTRLSGPARVASAIAKPFSEQGKFDRAQRRAVREQILVRKQKAAALENEVTRRYNRALARLKPDKNAAGIREKGLSREQLAVRIHLEGLVEPGGRGGLTAAQMRDRFVERQRKGLSRRAAQGERVKYSARDLRKIAELPDELLELPKGSAAAARVREAVEAGRELDKIAQDLEIKSGVVTKETARKRAQMPSMVALAGSTWAEHAIRELRKQGKREEAARLRRASIEETPRIVELRRKVAEAEDRLSYLRGGGGVEASERLARASAAKKAAERKNRDKVKEAEEAVKEAKATLRAAKDEAQAKRKKAESEEKEKARKKREEAAAKAREKKHPRLSEAYALGRSQGSASGALRRAENKLKREKAENEKKYGKEAADLLERHRLLESAVAAIEKRSGQKLKEMAREMRDSRVEGYKRSHLRTYNRNQAGQPWSARGRAGVGPDGRKGGQGNYIPGHSGYSRHLSDPELRVPKNPGAKGKKGREMRDKRLDEHLAEYVEMLLKDPKAREHSPDEFAAARDYQLLEVMRAQIDNDLRRLDEIHNDHLGVFDDADIAAHKREMQRSMEIIDAMLEGLGKQGLVDPLHGAGPGAKQAAKAKQRAEAEYRELQGRANEARQARVELDRARMEAARKSAKPLSKKQLDEINQPVRKAQAALDQAVAELQKAKVARGKLPKEIRKEYERAREALAAARVAPRGTERQITAARRELVELQSQLRHAEDEALGFTPPSKPELIAGEAVYIPHMRPRQGTRSVFAGGRGFTGPKTPKRTTGALIETGVLDWSPALLTHQAKRAVNNSVGPISAEALDDLIAKAAYVSERTGKPIAGRRALRMAQTDPDRVALVNVGGLRRALRKLDEAPVGETITRADIDAAVISGREMIENLEKGTRSSDYIAISKAAADEWRGIPKAGSNAWIRKWDTATDLWKGAILALSPRWYLNSTFGAAMQYGLLTGFDIRAIRRANRKGAVREAIPTREALNTMAEDVGWKGGIDDGRIKRLMTRGFELNNRIESMWRRAAYLNRAKRQLRSHGVRGRLSDMEIAHAISNMPPSIARQITRDIDLFMGEFRKFNAFEQAVVRRLIPFYSWLRVITKLTLSLPFRSPARAEALLVATKMGTAAMNPLDHMRPWYDRGAFIIPGTDLRVRTSSANSFATLVGFAEALGAMQGKQDFMPVARELGSWLHPLPQTAINTIAGKNQYGSPVLAPPTEKKRINPVTGRVEYVSETGMPFLEAMLQAALPGQAGPIRRALVGADSVYDTATTLELLLYRIGAIGPEGIIRKRTGKPINEKVGPGGVVSSAGAFFGAPITRENTRELERKHRQDVREAKREKKRAAKRRKRETG